MNNDEQWWWAKWIWFSGIRASAKTPIVSPWTQEPNLSRLTPMTSGVKIMRIFFRVNAKWSNVERFIIQRAFGPQCGPHTMMHGNVSLVLMRRELNWWSDPQLIVIKITMDWVFRWGGGGRMVIKAITTPVVKREEGGGVPTVLDAVQVRWQVEGKWGRRWERGEGNGKDDLAKSFCKSEMDEPLLEL